MDRLFDKHVCQCQREVTKRKYILQMVNTLLRRYACDSIGHVWKTDDKIKKLLAFLRAPAARRTNVSVTTMPLKGLTAATCPPTHREKFYREFEARSLRPGEDPAVYKWELEQALEKADPSLEAEAKKALLTRQFMKDCQTT